MRRLDALFFRKLTAPAIDWISTPLPHAGLQRRRGNFALVAAPMATVFQPETALCARSREASENHRCN
jgi:hypothetical protein